MTIAFVFPGQGSQAVGMGRALYERYPAAKAVFDEVDAALSLRLTRLAFEGPEAELVRTENAQPALMAVSLMALRALEAEGSGLNAASFVAGHSLGEYSALAAAGSFTLSETARLLRTRGQAMQAAAPEGLGAMAALLGVEIAQAEEIARKAATSREVCVVANDNAPGQAVVSGHKAAVERAVALASEAGARRSVFLAVSAPFHSPLMRPAAEVMAQALAAVPPRRPQLPLVANVTAKPVDNPATIRLLLVEQVTARVRWRESVLAMRAAGVTRLVELGAGKVLSGLGRRIDKELACDAAGTPEEISAVAKSITTAG